MFNESWEGKDLAGFIKTTLAQQMQKSKLGQFSNTFGISALLAPVTKKTSEENALKIADGIDMGYQVPKNIIPIIYGHVGMSNTQFDNGQKPSDVDADVIVQSVKMPISEGPIAGPARVETNSSLEFNTPEDTLYHLRHVVINDSYVIDPITLVANHKDVNFVMTLGDGTTTSKKTSLLELTNPLLGTDIEAVDDTTNDTFLNDLGDVVAAKGVNNVLYWNATAGQWEAKSFNTLLSEAGATYDGGAGGDGGLGGTGGDGGIGGEGGVGPSDSLGLKYTQWNPPPTQAEEIEDANKKTVTTITPPPTTGHLVVTGKGAPLKNVADPGDSYFSSDIDFKDIDKVVDEITATFYFPDGIYSETETVTTTLDGSTITLCGTQRPNLEGADSGNLDFLDPSITLSEDGQSTTSKSRDNGNVQVYIVLSTILEGDPANREFILHEESFPISHFKNGPYEYPHTMKMSSMNAGYGYKVNPIEWQDGALLPGGLTQFPYTTASCNSTDITLYDFKQWDLADYIKTYPDQILKASNTIKVYAWILEGDISTNTYLREISVCDPMDGYKDGYYAVGKNTVNPFTLGQSLHGLNPRPGATGVANYKLEKTRCASAIVAGTYSPTKSPDPLLVWDYSSMGMPGTSGDGGDSGLGGDTGTAGTQGSVTVPTLPPIPFVTGKDASYPGDGATVTPITLPTIKVSNDNDLSIDTLTITVSQGTLYATTVPTNVNVYATQNTSSLRLDGFNDDIQTVLNSGITFTPTTATFGDVSMTLSIVDTSGGASLDNKTIRSQAVTEYVAPYFTITVNDFSAGDNTFDGYVREIAIMNSVTNTTSNDSAATEIAGAINTYVGSPEWTATVSGAVVTVTGPVGLGASYNGIMPEWTGTMDVTITAITGGVSPSRKSQPIRNAGNLKTRFIPALAFTNTLTDLTVAYAQVAYRPPQGDGQTTLSEVGFMVGGRLIQTGVNGSFSAWQTAGYTGTLGWSNNPAWAFFDYLTNTTFGLGRDLIIDENGNDKLDADQKEALYMDIWNFGFWCAQVKAGNEIIDCNAIIYGVESKIEVLQKLAALGNGKFVYLNGNPRLIYDGSAFAHSTYIPTVKKLVNQSNAGNLMYQSGSIDNLYNVINVNFANRDNYYRLEEVQYKNTASIAKFGERETTIDFWGCSVKQQALWHGAWQYETEATNSELVTYIAGWDHFDLLPGDLICLNDTLRPDNSKLGGRVVSTGSGTVTLDRSAGSNVKIAVMDTSGVVQYGTATGTTATVSGTFQANAVWNIYTETYPDGTPLAENYRVIAVEESEDGIYAVTAQKHDPDKYTRVWLNTI